MISLTDRLAISGYGRLGREPTSQRRTPVAGRAFAAHSRPGANDCSAAAGAGVAGGRDSIGLSLLILVMVYWEVMLSKGQEWDSLDDPFWRVRTLAILFAVGLAGLIRAGM